jgi:hypothetical protein
VARAQPLTVLLVARELKDPSPGRNQPLVIASRGHRTALLGNAKAPEVLNNNGRSVRDLPEQRANDVPRDDRNDDVRHKDKGTRTPNSTSPDSLFGGGLSCKPSAAMAS